MARIRTVKPELFLNEQLAELPYQYRLLFIGLFNQADRSGRLLDRPKRLKAEIFPYDNVDVDKGLTALQEAGFILRYRSGEGASISVIQVLTFEKHQKIDKSNEKESILPAPRPLDYNMTSTSLVIDGEGKGREEEGKGTEGTPPADFYSDFLSDFNSLMKTKHRLEKKSREHFNARIKEGFSRSDFITAIQNAMADKFQQETGYKHLTPEYITRSDKLQKWLNCSPMQVIPQAKKSKADESIERIEKMQNFFNNDNSIAS